MRDLVLSVAVALVLAGCMGGDEQPNRDPKAVLKVSCAARLCTLNASGSSDPDGDPLTFAYRWAGGRFTTTEKAPTLEVPAPMGGNVGYKVNLVVRDGRGGAAATVAELRLGTATHEAPHLAVSTEAARVLRPGGELRMNATATYDETPATLRFEWILGPRRTFDPNATAGDNPCDPDVRFQTFSTGCFLEGNRSVTMSEPGTYTIHCHPHPWMMGRITVDPARAPAPATVAIRDFGFEPSALRVGAGSVVTFTNEDPAPHSATALDYSPGTTSLEGKVLRQPIAEAGDYVVRLVVTDGHGGRATKAWGVRVAGTAPRQPEVGFVNGTVPIAPTQVNDTVWAIPGFARVNVTLAWSDPTGEMDPDLRIGRGEDVTSEVGCSAVRGTGDRRNTTAIDCTVDGPDDFTVRIEAGTSVVHAWRLVVRSWAFLAPGFGDACVLETVEVGAPHTHGC